MAELLTELGSSPYGGILEDATSAGQSEQRQSHWQEHRQEENVSPTSSIYPLCREQMYAAVFRWAGTTKEVS